jgi:hypothetical protein
LADATTKSRCEDTRQNGEDQFRQHVDLGLSLGQPGSMAGSALGKPCRPCRYLQTSTGTELSVSTLVA